MNEEWYRHLCATSAPSSYFTPFQFYSLHQFSWLIHVDQWIRVRDSGNPPAELFNFKLIILKVHPMYLSIMIFITHHIKRNSFFHFTICSSTVAFVLFFSEPAYNNVPLGAIKSAQVFFYLLRPIWLAILKPCLLPSQGR